ncbi:MAG: hypothetical protein ACM3SY_11915 [Candidatus Omnitrophota bacterium]
MGLFISLYFNFNGITPEQYETVYEESKTLLNHFPIQLVRYTIEKKYDVERRIFTPNIVKNPGQDDEHWRVEGDSVSGKKAETFMLYKKEYMKDSGDLLPDKDVLWAPPDSLEYPGGNGYDLFGSKTQGYPYHFAMLAVSMLFESRFPGNAYINGDIEPWQVNVILKWMNQCSFLNGPIIKPICMDGVSLWKRLDGLYTDKEEMITRFKAVFRGSDCEMLETLLNHADPDVVETYFCKELNRWESLSQLGAKRLIKQWITTTRDLKKLIRFVKTPQGRAGKFKLDDLLNVLCAMFIHIPVEEREPLFIFSMNEKRLHTIGDWFTQTFMLMGGARNDVDYYISPAELFDVFSEFESDPAKRNELLTIIQTSEAENRDYLNNLRSQIEEIKKQKEIEEQAGSETEGEDLIDTLFEEYGFDENKEDAAQIIIESALSQRIRIPKEEELAVSFRDSLKKFVERNKDVLDKYLNNEDRNFLLTKIMEFSFREGIVLLDKVWKEIDNEVRLPVLKGILSLVIIHNDEINFWRWRIHLLETKSLWQYIALGDSETAMEPEPPASLA